MNEINKLMKTDVNIICFQCRKNLLKWEPIDAQRFVRYDEAHLYHLA